MKGKIVDLKSSGKVTVTQWDVLGKDDNAGTHWRKSVTFSRWHVLHLIIFSLTSWRESVGQSDMKLKKNILNHCLTVICSKMIFSNKSKKQKSLLLVDKVVLTRTSVHLLGPGSGWILATSLIAVSSMCEVGQFSWGGTALTHCTFITRKPVTLNSGALIWDRNPVKQRGGNDKKGKRPLINLHIQPAVITWPQGQSQGIPAGQTAIT